jgi:hypothetical protein
MERLSFSILFMPQARRLVSTALETLEIPETLAIGKLLHFGGLARVLT